MLRIFVKNLNRITTSSPLHAAGYKSIYNVEHLYPDERKEISRSVNDSVSDIDNWAINGAGSTDEFTGHIPLDEVQLQYSRSGGPGGQNVNKLNTKVELRFHVDSATWIPSRIKPKLMVQQKNNITKDGYLILTSDKTRRQMLNQADCFVKLRTMIWTAAKEPPQPSAEELEEQNRRRERARQRVLQEKRAHSLKKQQRRGDLR